MYNIIVILVFVLFCLFFLKKIKHLIDILNILSVFLKVFPYILSVCSSLGIIDVKAGFK